MVADAETDRPRSGRGRLSGCGGQRHSLIGHFNLTALRLHFANVYICLPFLSALSLDRINAFVILLMSTEAHGFYELSFHHLQLIR